MFRLGYRRFFLVSDQYLAKNNRITLQLKTYGTPQNNEMQSEIGNYGNCCVARWSVSFHYLLQINFLLSLRAEQERDAGWKVKLHVFTLYFLLAFDLKGFEIFSIISSFFTLSKFLGWILEATAQLSKLSLDLKEFRYSILWQPCFFLM